MVLLLGKVNSSFNDNSQQTPRPSRFLARYRIPMIVGGFLATRLLIGLVVGALAS